MADLSKITSKFDFQKIIGDVKSMISPVAIPEANKDDPVAYCLSELGKLAKDLAEQHSKQADTIAKISTMLGTLHQEMAKSCKESGSPEVQQPQVAASEEAKEEKQSEAPTTSEAKAEKKPEEPASDTK